MREDDVESVVELRESRVTAYENDGQTRLRSAGQVSDFFGFSDTFHMLDVRAEICCRH